MENKKSSYTRDELLLCGHGQLLHPDSAKLPLPNMLMFDRITLIQKDGGAFDKGLVEAELDVDPSLWFFACHFEGDPVMPGCLGLDALWQLVGFFITWNGYLGQGRALGVGEVKFTGQVLPHNKIVKYRLDIRRLMAGRLKMAVADGQVYVDGQPIYSAKSLRCGLFEQAPRTETLA